MENKTFKNGNGDKVTILEIDNNYYPNYPIRGEVNGDGDRYPYIMFYTREGKALSIYDTDLINFDLD